MNYRRWIAKDLQFDNNRSAQNNLFKDGFRGSNATIRNDWSRKEFVVPESVLEAIRHGQWDFEPSDVDEEEYRRVGRVVGAGAMGRRGAKACIFCPSFFWKRYTYIFDLRMSRFTYIL